MCNSQEIPWSPLPLSFSALSLLFLHPHPLYLPPSFNWLSLLILQLSAYIWHYNCQSACLESPLGGGYVLWWWDVLPFFAWDSSIFIGYVFKNVCRMAILLCHLRILLKCRFWFLDLGGASDSVFPTSSRVCWCYWPMTHTLSSKVIG